jgi:hypothetical protein
MNSLFFSHMIPVKASKHKYSILKSSDIELHVPYPYLRDESGNIEILNLSPNHGRSFVVKMKRNGRWVISKGNGLGYSTHNFLNMESSGKYIWGYLPYNNALRDFTIGQEVNALGIKTNEMEFVLELDKRLFVNSTNEIVKPILLQYSVECPYRISDFGFIPRKSFQNQIERWKDLNNRNFGDNYLIAADTLVKNLRILHDNNIMHNAIHVQNLTWALELLDFESSRSDKTPYDRPEFENNAVRLMPAEIIQTYEVITYISWCLGERIEFNKIDNIFLDYDFDLKKYSIN